MAAPLSGASNLPGQDKRTDASANAVLRDYFFDRYWELFGARAAVRGFVNPADSYRDHPDPFAEHFVDFQVETFLKDLDKKIRRLKGSVGALQSARREALAGRSTPNQTLKQRFKRLAAQVEGDAEDLHNMVSAVVDGLRVKNPSKPEGSAYSQDFFGAEVDFLTTHVNKAENGLTDMFLVPTNTVTVEELRGANVLTELKSIERVSKGIRLGL